MTVCIRAPHARWSTCTCDPCRANRNRLHKQARTGRFVPARSAEAWAVIDRLRADGWSPTAIASAAGIPRRAVESALSRRAANGRHTWSAWHAERIIAAKTPAAGYVTALGARRRLRALAVLGWSVPAIEAEMADPVGASTLFAIRAGRTDSIRPCIAERIRAVYDALHMRPAAPGSGATAAKAKANREGWAAPLAWDDIDDPTEIPDTTTGGGADEVDPVVVERLVVGRQIEHTRAERLAAVARMHEAGMSLKAIARNLHVHPRQVSRDLAHLGLERVA